MQKNAKRKLLTKFVLVIHNKRLFFYRHLHYCFMELNNDKRCCWTGEKVDALLKAQDGLFNASIKLTQLAMSLRDENGRIKALHADNRFCAQTVARYLEERVDSIYEEVCEDANSFLAICIEEDMKARQQQQEVNNGNMLKLLAAALAMRLDELGDDDEKEP